jgi:hypothetical protein
MTTTQLTAIASNRPILPTKELAENLALRIQSFRKRYSQTCAYINVRPVERPDDRLARATASVVQSLIREA